MVVITITAGVRWGMWGGKIGDGEGEGVAMGIVG